MPSGRWNGERYTLTPETAPMRIDPDGCLILGENGHWRCIRADHPTENSTCRRHDA